MSQQANLNHKNNPAKLQDHSMHQAMVTSPKFNQGGEELLPMKVLQVGEELQEPPQGEEVEEQPLGEEGSENSVYNVFSSVWKSYGVISCLRPSFIWF